MVTSKRKVEVCDADTLNEMRETWEHATMAKIGLKFQPDDVFKWLNWIDELGDKLNNSPNQKRLKYLDGFPVSFNTVITPERMRPEPGSYVFAARYPTHHPKAGQNNPDSGKPDLDALAHALYPEWTRCLKRGLIKSIPKGSAYQAERDEENHSDDDDDDYGIESESANAVSRRRINAQWICLVCGGIGHASNVDGMQCLTAQLGINVPKDTLRGVKYPDGLRNPHNESRARREPPSAHANRTDQQSSSSTRDTRDRRPRPNMRDMRSNRKPFPRKGKARQVDSEPPDETHDDNDDESDAESQPAQAEYVSVYHTIDTRDVRYNSFDSSDSDTPPLDHAHSRKSPTTKARQI